MSSLGLILAFVAIAAVAVLVTGSVWAGLIVAALELGFWGLSRHLKGAQQ